MINVTSQYPTQSFLAIGTTQIIAQVNQNNNTAVPSNLIPKALRRTALATSAPDGSGAAMYQFDSMINGNAFYACQSTMEAQRLILEAAASYGNEFYIELSPLSPQYYQILTWASNI